MRCTSQKLLQTVSRLLKIQYKPLTIVAYCSSTSWNGDVKQLLGCVVCVLFSGTKLSYLSCVLYELNFHSVFDVATSRLKVERIRNCLCCLPKGSLPHVTSQAAASVCTSSWAAFGVSLAKTLLCMANTFIWQAAKVLKRFSLWQKLGLSDCSCHRFCKAVLCVCVWIWHVFGSNSAFQCDLASSLDGFVGKTSCIPQREDFGPLVVLRSCNLWHFVT